MSTSPLLGGDRPPRQPSGSDVASLGPSDLSDSGSDVGMGAFDSETLDSDSDSLGTGERAAVAGTSALPGADILPDHVVDAEADSEDLQAELEFEEDRRDAQVAEQAEDAAARDLADGHGLDRPADVGGLAQLPDEAGEDASADDGAA